MSRAIPLGIGIATLLMLPVLASAQNLFGDDAPPQNARSLSEILRQVEARPDFAYIKDIEWDDDTYKVEYQTREGDEEEIEIDPVSGEVGE